MFVPGPVSSLYYKEKHARETYIDQHKPADRVVGNETETTMQEPVHTWKE